jgi:hypothetical protein
MDNHSTEVINKPSSEQGAVDVTRFFFLNDISLWDCSLRREREYRWGEHTTENCSTQTFRSVEPELLEVEVEGESDKKMMLRALVKLGVRMVPNEQEAEGDGPDPIFTLEATFCADYFILSQPPEDVFVKFIEFNCIHNVWPFWRQHVFDTLKRASLPVPSVPLYAGQSKYRKKKVTVAKVLGEDQNASK